MAWNEYDIELDGLKTHYIRTGGSGSAVVLAHGLTDAGLCMSRVATALAGEHDVVMYDARGHGGSSLPEGVRNSDTLARDLLSLIAGLALDRPAVIGHSMGANTAARAASLDPAAIGALVLEDPPWGAAMRPPNRDWATRLAAMREASHEQLVEMCRAENPGWHEDEVGPWAKSKREFNGAFLKGDFSLGDWRQFAPAIRCHALLVTGSPEQGAIVMPEVAAEAKGLVPGLEVVHIEGAGHNIRREGWERYLGAVRTFLGARRQFASAALVSALSNQGGQQSPVQPGP